MAFIKSFVLVLAFLAASSHGQLFLERFATRPTRAVAFDTVLARCPPNRVVISVSCDLGTGSRNVHLQRFGSNKGDSNFAFCTFRNDDISKNMPAGVDMVMRYVCVRKRFVQTA